MRICVAVTISLILLISAMPIFPVAGEGLIESGAIRSCVGRECRDAWPLVSVLDLLTDPKSASRSIIWPGDSGLVIKLRRASSESDCLAAPYVNLVPGDEILKLENELFENADFFEEFSKHHNKLTFLLDGNGKQRRLVFRPTLIRSPEVMKNFAPIYGVFSFGGKLIGGYIFVHDDGVELLFSGEGASMRLAPVRSSVDFGGDRDARQACLNHYFLFERGARAESVSGGNEISSNHDIDTSSIDTLEGDWLTARFVEPTAGQVRVNGTGAEIRRIDLSASGEESYEQGRRQSGFRYDVKSCHMNAKDSFPRVGMAKAQTGPTKIFVRPYFLSKDAILDGMSTKVDTQLAYAGLAIETALPGVEFSWSPLTTATDVYLALEPNFNVPLGKIAIEKASAFENFFENLLGCSSEYDEDTSIRLLETWIDRKYNSQASCSKLTTADRKIWSAISQLQKTAPTSAGTIVFDLFYYVKNRRFKIKEANFFGGGLASAIGATSRRNFAAINLESGDYSVTAHEIGHLLGATHASDATHVASSGKTGAGFFIDSDVAYGTIMTDVADFKKAEFIKTKKVQYGRLLLFEATRDCKFFLENGRKAAQFSAYSKQQLIFSQSHGTIRIGSDLRNVEIGVENILKAANHDKSGSTPRTPEQKEALCEFYGRRGVGSQQGKEVVTAKFDTNSDYVLNSKAVEQAIKSSQAETYLLYGYSDCRAATNADGDAYNLGLSLRRSKAVEDLIKKTKPAADPPKVFLCPRGRGDFDDCANSSQTKQPDRMIVEVVDIKRH